jgi:hypothetical protein
MRPGSNITAPKTFGEIHDIGFDISADFPGEVAASVAWHSEGLTEHLADDLVKIYGVGESARERWGRALLLDFAEGIVLAAERHLANAQNYAAGARSGSPAQEALELAQSRLRKARMYFHYANVLADGLLPECGHPVTEAIQSVGIWFCTHPDHKGDYLRLTLTDMLMRGV